MSQPDITPDPIHPGETPASPLRLAPDAETAAAACLAIFLTDALPPDAAAANSLAALLFAHGAADALARSASLDPQTHGRLERALIRSIAGASWRGAARWRRTLDELERTARGNLLRRRGDEAAQAWLRGEPSSRRWEEALAAMQRADA